MVFSTNDLILLDDIIYVVDAFDADVSDNLLKYSIIGGEDQSLFSIDKHGAIRIRERLLPSPEMQNSALRLIVAVADNDGKNSSVALHFYPTDTANFPQFLVWF